jgi:predicted acylesterase/phospholipase RssA
MGAAKERLLPLGHVVQIKPDLSPEVWTELQERESPLRFQAPDGSFYLTDQELLDARALGLRFEVIRRIDEAELPVRFSLPHDGAVNDWPPEDARLAVLARLLAEDRANGSVHIRFLGRNHTVPPDGFVLDRAGGERRYVWQVVPAEVHAARPALRDRFQRLRAVCADPDARVVLSLGSGGLKLFAHATAIRLFETLGLGDHFAEIWGSSAGAMAGLLYAQGLSPHAIEQLGYDLYTGRVDLALRPSKLQFLRHLVRDALLPSFGTSGAGFVDCADGLSRMLERYCGAIEPRVPFYCIAFNLLQCRPEVLTPGEVPAHLADLLVQTEARSAALASASVPLLFVPRVIPRRGHSSHYIDGSTTEDVPLHSIVRKWDLDRAAGVERRERLVIVYVKLTGGLESYRSHPGRIGKLRLMQTVAAAGIETMHRRDLEILRARPDVRLLGLELRDSSPDFFETRRIAEFVRAAKECFPEQLAAIEERLRAEERHR